MMLVSKFLKYPKLTNTLLKCKTNLNNNQTEGPILIDMHENMCSRDIDNSQRCTSSIYKS